MNDDRSKQFFCRYFMSCCFRNSFFYCFSALKRLANVCFSWTFFTRFFPTFGLLLHIMAIQRFFVRISFSISKWLFFCHWGSKSSDSRFLYKHQRWIILNQETMPSCDSFNGRKSDKRNEAHRHVPNKWSRDRLILQFRQTWIARKRRSGLY